MKTITELGTFSAIDFTVVDWARQRNSGGRGGRALLRSEGCARCWDAC